jgi:hypothetical protein
MYFALCNVRLSFLSALQTIKSQREGVIFILFTLLALEPNIGMTHCWHSVNI